MKVSELLNAAKSQTGLDQLGDDSILAPLEILVDSINREAKLSERGEQSVQRTLIGHLVNRLRIEDYLAQNPELLERPVERPMFVFGLPRTGTTLLINLLNEDPMRRSFLRWESMDPVPPPKISELKAGPRFDKCQELTEMSLKYAPHISAIHHEDADSPTECQFLMAPSFVAEYYDSMYDIPSYGRYMLYEADYLPAFKFHKRYLQLLQAETGGRWTLKNPWHPLFLDSLRAVYSDAQLVMTHRDPVEVVGSACSLLKAVRPMFSDEVDLLAIGRTLLETFDVMVERTTAYLETHGHDSICHVQYLDMMSDPVGEVKRVYRHFGEELSDVAEQAMQQYLESNPKGKHGTHTYSLEDYGLTEGAIRERYQGYMDRFGVKTRG